MDEGAAPVFKVPEREIIAVEHPMIVQNIDNGIKTFGNNHPFQRVSLSRPLYTDLAAILHIQVS
jgi:hypothetical protein